MATIKIAGNTYAARNLIKNRGGKYDAATKTWSIDEAQWAIIAKMDWGRAARGCYIVGTEQAKPSFKTVSGVTQICRKCGSYCYGDCQA